MSLCESSKKGTDIINKNIKMGYNKRPIICTIGLIKGKEKEWENI